MPERPLARPIAGRSRCTRPSRLVTVPSFSGYASPGNTTSANRRALSLSTVSTAITVCAVLRPRSHSARSGWKRTGSA